MNSVWSAPLTIIPRLYQDLWRMNSLWFRNALACLVCVAALGICPNLGAQPLNELQASLTRLNHAAENTFARLQTNAALWEVEMEFPASLKAPKFLIIRAQQGDRFRLRAFILDDAQKRSPLFTLLQRDGLWYVMEGAAKVKTLPYGAEFTSINSSIAYQLIATSELMTPRFSSAAKVLTEPSDGTLYRYRVLAGAQEKRMLDQALQGFEDMRKRGQPLTARNNATMDWLRDALNKGIPYTAELRTGLVIEQSARNRKRTMKGFNWEDPSKDRSLFEIPEGAWKDDSGSLLPSSVDDAVLVAHDPHHVPGKGEPSAESFLLDLRSGKLRRLPVDGVGTLPGCFLKDHRQVLTTRIAFDEHPDIVIVDLPSGTLKRVEPHGDVFRPLGFPALSADGRQVLMLEMARGPGLLDFTLLTLNLETLIAQPLGKPGRMGAPVSSLPDGTGYILKRFLPAASKDPGAIEPRVICKMDLKGRLKDLRPGDSPLVLPQAKRILFEEDRKWYTCSFEGSDIRQYANGMRGYGQPAISPDGKRMLWVKFSEGTSPKLHLIDFEKSEGRPATEAPGFTGLPRW